MKTPSVTQGPEVYMMFDVRGQSGLVAVRSEHGFQGEAVQPQRPRRRQIGRPDKNGLKGYGTCLREAGVRRQSRWCPSGQSTTVRPEAGLRI